MHPVTQSVRIESLEAAARAITSRPIEKVTQEGIETVLISIEKDSKDQMPLQHAFWTTGEKTAALFLTTLHLLEGCLSMEIFKEPLVKSRIVEEQRRLESLTALVKEKIKDSSVFCELEEGTRTQMKSDLKNIQQNMIAVVKDIEVLWERTLPFMRYEHPLEESVCHRFHLIPELCRYLNITLLFRTQLKVEEGIDVSLGLTPFKKTETSIAEIGLTNSLRMAMQAFSMGLPLYEQNSAYPKCFHTNVFLTALGQILPRPPRRVEDTRLLPTGWDSDQQRSILTLFAPKRAFNCMTLYYSSSNPVAALFTTPIQIPSSLEELLMSLIEKASDEEKKKKVRILNNCLVRKLIPVEEFLSDIGEILDLASPDLKYIADIKKLLDHSPLTAEPQESRFTSCSLQ